MSADDKTHVIVAEREGVAPAYIKHLGRDGSWTTTWDAASARRFGRALAERHAAALSNAAQRGQFSAIEAAAAGKLL